MKRTLLALALVACGPSFVPPAVVVHPEDCDAAQQTLERLGCSWARSPKGVPFARACVDVAAAGIDLAPKCIAAASSCEEAKRCRP